MAEPNEIVEAWRSFDDKRRADLLGKMTPEQKRNLRMALEADTIVPPPRPESAPGFFKRTAQGVGLPTSKQELEAMKPSTAEQVLGPGATVAKLAYRYGENVFNQGREALGEIQAAGKNIKEGGPLLANWGKGYAAGADFLFKGLLAPVGGGSLMAWGEDIAAKNWSGAAGDAVAALINAWTLKASRPLAAEGKVSKVAFAANLKRGIEDVKTVLPDIERASKGAPPKTVKGLLDTVNQAKRDMNTEAGLAMQPIRGFKFVPTQIADFIKNRITPDMIQTAEGRSQMKMFLAKAKDFEKPWTYEQLDALRMRLGSELSGYWKMNAAEKTAYLKAHPSVAADVEIVNGIQEIVYPAMDRAAGKPTGYFASLKQRQSTLIDLQKNLQDQVDTLGTKSAAIKGSPRFGSENVSMYMAGTGAPHPGFSLHRIHRALFREDPLGTANKAVSRAYTGLPTAKAYVSSYPVRQLFLDLGEKPPKKSKTPGQQIRDLKEIQSSNPNLPIGTEP